jgi:hypothetical protein
VFAEVGRREIMGSVSRVFFPPDGRVKIDRPPAGGNPSRIRDEPRRLEGLFKKTPLFATALELLRLKFDENPAPDRLPTLVVVISG